MRLQARFWSICRFQVWSINLAPLSDPVCTGQCTPTVYLFSRTTSNSKQAWVGTFELQSIATVKENVALSMAMVFEHCSCRANKRQQELERRKSCYRPKNMHPPFLASLHKAATPTSLAKLELQSLATVIKRRLLSSQDGYGRALLPLPLAEELTEKFASSVPWMVAPAENLTEQCALTLELQRA